VPPTGDPRAACGMAGAGVPVAHLDVVQEHVDKGVDVACHVLRRELAHQLGLRTTPTSHQHRTNNA